MVKNYEKDLVKRERIATLLQQGISHALKQGKKPAKFVKVIQLPDLLLTAELERISLSEGKGKSQDTRNGYRLYIGRLKKYLKHIEQENMLLGDFTEERAQEFKEYLIEEMELKNVTVNCTIQPLKQFLEILFSKKQIPINPFSFYLYLFYSTERIMCATRGRYRHAERLDHCTRGKFQGPSYQSPAVDGRRKAGDHSPAYFEAAQK